MTTLDPHPFSKLFPPISDEDFGKLAADIKLNGLHQHIVRYQGKILDGNNRYRACELVKIAPKFADFAGDDAAARNYVISANIHRRHLSPDQRRDIIATLLKADPSQSNRQVAEQAKVSHVTVGAVRNELETTGQIDQLDKTTGADGKTRKGKGKPKGKGGSKGKAITFQEVVDGKTARNAYHVLEEHLLDALQEINDRSSFDHADEYAQATIETFFFKILGSQNGKVCLMNLFFDGRVKRVCEWCGQRYLPHVADQRFCSPYCRNKIKALEAKSARRVWWRAGRPMLREDEKQIAS